MSTRPQDEETDDVNRSARAAEAGDVNRSARAAETGDIPLETDPLLEHDRGDAQVSDNPEGEENTGIDISGSPFYINFGK